MGSPRERSGLTSCDGDGDREGAPPGPGRSASRRRRQCRVGGLRHPELPGEARGPLGQPWRVPTGEAPDDGAAAAAPAARPLRGRPQQLQVAGARLLRPVRLLQLPLLPQRLLLPRAQPPLLTPPARPRGPRAPLGACSRCDRAGMASQAGATAGGRRDLRGTGLGLKPKEHLETAGWGAAVFFFSFLRTRKILFSFPSPLARGRSRVRRTRCLRGRGQRGDSGPKAAPPPPVSISLDRQLETMPPSTSNPGTPEEASKPGNAG